MNDMSATIIARSDQINAADLIGISRTITVREVRIKAGEDQPVTIMIEGDDKAFRPCKGVRRLLVRVWGPDANKYIGQSLTIYCDPTVTWAGKQEGGIRVSHMTGLDEKIIEYMRTSREKTKPYEIEPLVAGKPQAAAEDLGAWAHKFIANVNRAPTLDKLDTYAGNMTGKLHDLSSAIPEAHTACLAAVEAKRASFAPAGGGEDNDPFGAEPAEEPDDPAARTLANIRESIDGCKTAAELATCDKAWLKHRAAYDDDTAAGIDALIAGKRKSLAGEG